jgi:AbrB family looped-hinge helix DNA binding protein
MEKKEWITVQELPTIEEVLRDPAASFWLKDALRSALSRDPVDGGEGCRSIGAIVTPKMLPDSRFIVTASLTRSVRAWQWPCFGFGHIDVWVLDFINLMDEEWQSKELYAAVRNFERWNLSKQAKLTTKGQITVPLAIRRALGVRPGDLLLFEEDKTGVRVRPVRTESPFAKYRGIGNRGIGSGKKAINRWVRETRGQ